MPCSLCDMIPSKQIDKQGLVEKRHNNLTKFLMAGLFFSCSFRQARFFPILAPQDIFLLAASLLILVHKFEDYRIKNFSRYVLLVLFLFLYFALNSLLVSINPGDSIVNYLKVIFAFVLLPVAVWGFVQNADDVRNLYWAFVAGVIVSSGIDIFFASGIAEGRSSGFTGHPVFNGILIAFAITIVMASKYETRLLMLGGYAVNGFLLFAFTKTASLTGLIIILSSLGLNIMINFHFRRIFQTLVFLIIAIYTLTLIWNAAFFSFTKSRLLLTFSPRTGFSTNSISGTSTVEARWFSIKESWIRIQDSPIFGHGLDPAGRITAVNLEPHNFFVLAWQTGGIILLLLAIVFFFISMHFFWQAFIQKATREMSLIFATWIALFSSPLIYERSVLTPIFLAFVSLQYHLAKNRKSTFLYKF